MSRSAKLDRVQIALALAVGALSFSVSMVVELLVHPDVSRAAVPSTAVPSARAAKTFSLNESGRLSLTSKQGFTLNERGTASGTIAGAIYVHLTIVSTDHVRAEVNIYPSGGSITGEGTASYLRGSTMAGFNGTISIGRGTGSYADARGSGLSFSGTIARSNDAITVHVAGRVSD